MSEKFFILKLLWQINATNGAAWLPRCIPPLPASPARLKTTLKRSELRDG